MAKVQIRPYCVYCGESIALMPSANVPDGTLYPGVQQMCVNSAGCIMRIHLKYHKNAAEFPECRHCYPREVS